MQHVCIYIIYIHLGIYCQKNVLTCCTYDWYDFFRILQYFYRHCCVGSRLNKGFTWFDQKQNKKMHLMLETIIIQCTLSVQALMLTKLIRSPISPALPARVFAILRASSSVYDCQCFLLVFSKIFCMYCNSEWFYPPLGLIVL